MKNKITTIIALIVLIAILVVLGYGYYKKITLNVQNPLVTMEVKDYGTIKIELYPDKAPNTVKNFITLANNGFYDGLKFHRVVKEFMIQGGDHEGTGSGDAQLGYLNGNDDKTKYAIEGEFFENGFKQNDLNLTAGVIAMARGDYTQYSSTLRKQSYNSAGTQFFIMTTDKNTNLSGLYAGFGKVVEGMDVVTKISEVEVTTANSTEESSSENTDDSNATKETPAKDVIISSVKVETYGINYPKPKTISPFNVTKWLYKMYGLEYNEEE